MPITRRRFMKMSAASSAALTIGVGVKSPTALAIDASIATLVTVDPLTLEYKVFGPCCHLCPNKLIVSHYQPVAIVEVIKGGGDSLTGAGLGTPFSSVGVDKNDYTTFSVRIWELPDWAIDVAMGGQGCKLCGVKKAKRPNAPVKVPGGVCGPMVDAGMGAALGAINSALPACFPKMLYNSELDPAWRTGCRDSGVAAAVGTLACSNGFTSSLSFMGGEICIGPKWGPLYPRQMASIQDNASIAAGIAAYRAIHVSGFSLRTFPFNAAQMVGKLQQTAPFVTPGFKAGSTLLDSAMRAYPISPMHTYAFTWWVPVKCCKKVSQIAGACTPQVPCM